MRIEYTKHWYAERKVRREEITDDIIEYAIQYSPQYKDKAWQDALNAIAFIPWKGRYVKVVYTFIGKRTIKIITACWLQK